jgi:hypothetical protein
MSQLKIATRENQTVFRPGDEISGAAGWQLDQPAKRVEIRLFWHTDGKGTKDVGIADSVRFDNPQPEEARPFKFVAPCHPWSFSGRLVSLLWALEIVVEPGPDSARFDLVISPTGGEVLLHKDESA